jgi:putative transposase
MFPERPRRLTAFSYLGCYRYSLTFCRAWRRVLFVEACVVEPIREQILRTAIETAFAVLAYCFMPDHLHVLAQGTADDADLLAFAKLLRQRSTIEYRRLWRGDLWQPGFYERVLRAEEDTETVARYILYNAVRKGLVSHPSQYPFLGTTLVPLESL